ncbi:hypothetical protein E2C01_069888 [Portunus trituberculatus]|uniref:Uncharacterized protein n=1 Tax=Portunus trituberculatus TaxID=210409 RepID=A0A5B7I3J4_PORTR|nr:hypothetical protein [Portunus trituberculatus]
MIYARCSPRPGVLALHQHRSLEFPATVQTCITSALSQHYPDITLGFRRPPPFAAGSQNDAMRTGVWEERERKGEEGEARLEED